MTRRHVGMSARFVGLIVGALAVVPTCRLVSQDTSAIDRGVRIGIVYKPGVRPGMVMLPRTGQGLDSARAMIARDLDYSDRFEIITLPSGSLQGSIAGWLRAAGSHG